MIYSLVRKQYLSKTNNIITPEISFEGYRSVDYTRLFLGSSAIFLAFKGDGYEKRVFMINVFTSFLCFGNTLPCFDPNRRWGHSPSSTATTSTAFATELIDIFTLYLILFFLFFFLFFVLRRE